MKVTYLSKIFSPSLKILPKQSDALSKSQKLLTYYGFISPSGLGTYTIMPILQRSLDKLINLIDNNMGKIDAEKLTMPSLGRASIWKTSGRWETIGTEMFRFKDRDNKDFCLQPTHEEEVTSLLNFYSIIKGNQLPVLFYQITPKFRNEKTLRSGLLRCREFLMKDLYTFDTTAETANVTYDRVLSQYHSLFTDLGISYMCVSADCGNMGGLLSHEFHVESAVGEDSVLKCDTCGNGFNQELNRTVNKSNVSCPHSQCSGTLIQHKAIEIGHCFLLGDRYSKAFDLHYFDNGEKRFIMMGCFGIGVTRLLATCVEVLSSETEIRWPEPIVPYRVAVLLQKENAVDEPSNDLKNMLINGLRDKFHESNLCPSDIMVDDRVMTIGKKLNNAKCTGIPWAIVVKNKDIVETVDIYSERTAFLSVSESINMVSKSASDVRLKTAAEI